ncbi:hypothetical protein BU23DRAFT_227890 [Bimuria novae-zelandiae CBS 107.79]|uniref:Uncharacterized protein n=1 Tax=Bimuria novae-zelandiae CBS 107.79 TaxID=1447943 RepID=A0A6A5VLG3_9PLEO|nr:hypothetical protein BU23DRAFT_227890 [Bimuria novae-zelandiae CBS 107.79]
MDLVSPVFFAGRYIIYFTTDTSYLGLKMPCDLLCETCPLWLAFTGLVQNSISMRLFHSEQQDNFDFNVLTMVRLSAENRPSRFGRFLARVRPDWARTTTASQGPMDAGWACCCGVARPCGVVSRKRKHSAFDGCFAKSILIFPSPLVDAQAATVSR